MGGLLKRILNIGAYGWRHSHWSDVFYPEDLPMVGEEDWRLAYYSNEFNTVLVPANYWQLEDNQDQVIDCERWLDDINTEFLFLVECHGGMFAHVSLDELSKQLRILQPQLAALVFPKHKQKLPESVHNRLLDLADELMVNTFIDDTVASIGKDLQLNKIWRQDSRNGSGLALLEDDLTNLRALRTIVDDFMSQETNILQQSEYATMIVNHSNLTTKDLGRFRIAVEIMGY